uniref:Uncharacterized protein n=1 Tax=Panagrolaimus sp. ES5 TaxID=591445 RepID=A0AC34FTB2_9BILA
MASYEFDSSDSELSVFLNSSALSTYSAFTNSTSLLSPYSKPSSVNDAESASTSTFLTSTSSTSTSSISTTTSSVSSSHATCFFDGTTQINQNFSIPEKILYYMAKNPKNAAVYQKLIQTCKYFFALNPIIVAPVLACYEDEWCTCKIYVSVGVFPCRRRYFKINNLPSNYKVWLSDEIVIQNGDSNILQIMPRIYRSDAMYITFENDYRILSFKEFLFLASNAKRMVLDNRSIKYENGDTVLFETIIKSLPKLKLLYYESDDGKDITSNSAMNLIEDFERFSAMNLIGFTENFDVEIIYDFIIKNPHIELNLCYHSDISEIYKERIFKYSDRLRTEYYFLDECRSTIRFDRKGYVYPLYDPSDLESVNSDSSLWSWNERLLFPWNNDDEEGWALPWDVDE